MKKIQILLPLLSAIFLMACVKDTLEGSAAPDTESEEITAMDDLSIPNGFAFETEQEISLTITDATNGTRYVVLVEGNEVANKIVVDQTITDQFNVPLTTEKLTLLRRSAYSLEKIQVPITGNTVNYSY